MIDIDVKQFDELAAAVGKAGNSLPRELATACNKTAKGMRTPISKQIRQVLAVKASVVKPFVNQRKVAKPASLVNRTTESSVEIKPSKRMPLRDFGARQTKRGVSYKLNKQSGRQAIGGAFIVQKLGGHVFKRKPVARKRTPPDYNGLPITKLFGASPWGVFVQNKMDGPAADEAQVRLAKEIDRRIQYNVFKASELD